MADENKIIDLETLSHFKTKQDLYNLEKFKLKSDSTELKGAVRYDTAQVLTEEQKAQARANIGVTSSGGNGEGSTVSNKFDEEGKLKAEYLPDMIEALKPLDDVVEGYLKPEDGLFYTTDEYTDQIEGESGKIYLDLNSNTTYRWGGTQYILIGGGSSDNSSGGSGGSTENEIVIVTYETIDDETMTGTISEETMDLINNTVGVKPIFFSFWGAFVPYTMDGSFSIGIPGATLSVELYDDCTFSVHINAQMELNEEGLIDLDLIPRLDIHHMPDLGFYDDVIEGYLNPDDNRFYRDSTNVGHYDGPYEGESGKIYVDLRSNNTYRWSGSTYVRINPDEYTIATNEDINALFT